MLLALFKTAFAQLHTADPDPTQPLRAPTADDLVASQANTLLTGLNDFDASFGGDFTHHDGHGHLSEQGHSDFRIAQQTTVQRSAATDSLSIAQTQSSQLDAVYAQGRGQLPLDVAMQFGNYDIYRVHDKTESTTTISARHGRLTNAVNHLAVHRNLGWQKLEHGRIVDAKDTPEIRSQARDLF